MAVSGVFQADFESFYAAVQKADVQLRNFDAGAAKVESTLSRMTDGFSGRRIISEATLMAEVFERAGGASKFTQAELSRMGATGAEAIAKMRAIGTEVPQNLERMTQAAAGANPPIQSLSQSYRQFDGVLAAMGINIGPQVKGLEDISNAAGKSAGQLGFLGTAGLALGAGFAGWGIGRMIAEFFELDSAVEKAWRTLMNYGDAGAQAVAAKQDVINRAIANGAQATIGYTDAIQFNIDASRRASDAKIDWTAKLAAAHKEVRGLSEATIRDIEIAQRAGATQEQITNKFNITAGALKVLAENQKLAAQAADEHRARAEALDKAYEKLNSQIANERGLAQMEEEAARLKRQEENTRQLRMMESAAHQAEMAELDERVARESAAEASRIEANQREIDALLAAGAAHQEAGNVAKASADQTIMGYQGVAQQITITGEAVREWINLMKYTAQANAILSENSLFTTQSQRDRVAGLGFPTMPTLPSNAPIGGAGAPGMNVQNTFNIVDTEAGITKRVSDNIMQSVRRGTQLTQ